MSIFEDTTEVHYNATHSVTGPKHVDTISEALDRVAAPPSDCAIVLDWDVAYSISDNLDIHVTVADHVVKEHVELTTQRIGKRLGTKATVHGEEYGRPIGTVIDPAAVRYDNSIMDPGRVVAIKFGEEYE